MEDALISTVLKAAESDDSLPEEAKLLVLAAIDGDQLLSKAIESGTEVVIGDELQGSEEQQPIGAYLKSIKVTGFRGVGQTVTLALQPTPGLTVIAGRNGSGKSSIAEALELALTGASYRWENKSALWKESWRNLHSGTTTEIRIELAEEGCGATTVGLDWATDASLEEQKSWVQRAGKAREPGLGSLGWTSALELYRPLLSYDELGGRLESRPSDLHDALEKILGLQRITDAQGRLVAQQKKLGEPQAQAKALLPNLKLLLTASEDSRAQAAVLLLQKRNPDVEAVAQLTKVEASSTSSDILSLRGLSRLSVPDTHEVLTVANNLQSAVQQVAAVADSAVKGMATKLDLVQRALAIHAQSGVQPCPVCGEGTLDEPWAEGAQTQIATQNAELTEFKRAQVALTSARSAARRAIEQVPPPQGLAGLALVTLASAQAAQQKWAAAPASDLDLAHHLEAEIAPLVSALTELRDEARQQLEQREDRWSPIAIKLAEWVALTKEAATRSDVQAQVDRASKWLKTHTGELRDQRLKPIADRARKIWSTLRQESNVDLGSINLAGQATRRRVDLRAEVDGAETGALGVMSQGELHALALSLFLPRATMEASPFRFIVLDDPIQAMDPAKVEGFVQVLQELSKTHQVLVLSHDDRLPQAIRHSGTDARILEVSRANDSRIAISNAMDPAERYLEDARALAKDENVPAAIKDKITPNLSRMALESACRDVFMANSFSAGRDRISVETTWQESKTTRKRLALALNLEVGPALDGWLNVFPHRRAALVICGRKAHEGSQGNHLYEIRDVSTTVGQVRQAKW